MAKKRKILSDEPASTVAPLPEQLQTLTESEQPEQQIEIKSEPQMEEDQTLQPEGGLVAVKMEETAEEEPQNMNEEEEEDNENGCQTAEDGGDKGVAEGEEDDSDGELEEEPIEKILEPFGKDQLIALVMEAVSKFPDIIEIVHRMADLDPAHRKIFVHGLGWDSNRETLISEFSKYGEIEDCKAVSDKASGKSKGYGFILFKHRSGARKALKNPQKKIGNRLTSCQLSSAGPVPAPPPVGPPVSEYTQRKIFISNVAADIDPQQLTEFFARYGEIEEGPLGLDKNTGKFKGFCLFVYKSMEGSKKALQEPQKVFEGKILNCQKAIDGPKSNKPNFPPHQTNNTRPQHHLQHFSSRKEKTKYTSSSGPTHGHLMAPSGPALGYNPSVSAPVLGPSLGQALAALLTSQGAGFGATMNQGMPPMMNNPSYGNQIGASYGGSQPAYINQGGYQNPQLGQGPTRPASGGSSYMGYGQ